MPLISIVMPCYNAGRYLFTSVQSVINQTLRDWELIIVDDGSTDNSFEIAEQIAFSEKRVRVIHKSNGGYVSARLHGYSQADRESRYILFYDADDQLDPIMLQTLYSEMEANPSVGAAYCDHMIMDEKGKVYATGIDMPRYVPTAFWLKTLNGIEKNTPFISIFCWTKMMEPMTMMRKVAYEQTPGWDIDFGKGQGNIGEGVYLFSEIALNWKVHFVDKPLYFYRRHSEQMSSISTEKMQAQVNKVILKWKERIKKDRGYAKKVKAAILFLKYRLSVKQRLGSLPYQLRRTPLVAFKSSILLIFEYCLSLPLVFSYRNLTN